MPKARPPRDKPQYREVFAREARALASLEHPNVIPLYEYYEGENGPVLVMRFVHSNAQQMAGHSTEPRTLNLCKVAQRVAEALDYCSAQGLSHRDVKPDNILIGNQYEVYLADFGLSALLDDDKRWAHAEGAKQFLSPEVLLDRYITGKAEHRRLADQFSLGVTLYYLLTGHLPHDQGGDPSDASTDEWNNCTALRLLRGNHPVLSSQRNPKLPSAVDSVLFRMMSIDPEDRFQSNGEAVFELDQALAGHTGGEFKVFISYARQDETTVRELVDELLRKGISILWDRDIAYGVDWEDHIEQSMTESDLMLVVLSTHSGTSIEVKNEWRYWASFLKKPLITLVLEDCPIPYRLFPKHHIYVHGRPIGEVATK